MTSPHVEEAQPGTWSNCRVCGNQFFVAGMTARGTGGRSRHSPAEIRDRFRASLARGKPAGQPPSQPRP